MTTIYLALMVGVLAAFWLWLLIHAARFDARMKALDKACGLPGPVGTQARKERAAVLGENHWFGG